MPTPISKCAPRRISSKNVRMPPRSHLLLAPSELRANTSAWQPLSLWKAGSRSKRSPPSRYWWSAEHFKAVLRHYHERAGGQPNAFAVCLAKTLIQAAYHHVAVSDDEVERLKRIAAKLPSIPNELTAKNKALLREFESDSLRAKLIYLPEQLMAVVTKRLETGRVDLVKAQVAIAIDFVLAIPLRPQNLSRLNWQRHFLEPDGPKGRMLVHIPEAEMKSKGDYDAELAKHVAHRLRWYRRHILVRLTADPDGDLFVNRRGERKSQETLTEQIIEVIEQHLGIHMTPHQFRHLAGSSYLDENPADTETVRQLLGHASIKTTQIYVGNGSRRASRAYNDVRVRAARGAEA